MTAAGPVRDGEVTYGIQDNVEVSAVVTLFNEQENIEPLTRSLIPAFRACLGKTKFELVLVLNGPLDGTPEIASRLTREYPEITLMSVYPNRGYGGGLLAGISAARGQVVGYLDGDQQLDPEEVAYIFREAASTSTDLVKARRVSRHDGLLRLAISSVFNLLFRLMYGGAACDINAKPKVFKRATLEKLCLSSTDWFLDAEAMIKARRLALTVKEIPVDFGKRKFGSSNVRVVTLVEFLKNMWKYRNGNI